MKHCVSNVWSEFRLCTYSPFEVKEFEPSQVNLSKGRFLKMVESENEFYSIIKSFFGANSKVCLLFFASEFKSSFKFIKFRDY